MHRLLPDGSAYIRLTAWSQNLEGGMIEAIRAHKDAPAIVIDLRGNPGSSGLMVRNVAKQFFKGEIKAGRALARTGKPITLAFDLIEVIKIDQLLEGTGLYAGPVTILVDNDSGSASELFAAMMPAQEARRRSSQARPRAGACSPTWAMRPCPAAGSSPTAKWVSSSPTAGASKARASCPDVAIPHGTGGPAPGSRPRPRDRRRADRPRPETRTREIRIRQGPAEVTGPR